MVFAREKNSQVLLRILFFICLIVASFNSRSTVPDRSGEIDDVLEQVNKSLHSNPEKTTLLLKKLEELKPFFTTKQSDLFVARYAGSLGIRGQHNERIQFIQKFSQSVIDANIKVQLNYQLSDSLNAVGEYESALKILNESIALLPEINSFGGNITTLQSAIGLLNSLGAYDEALVFANRIEALADDRSGEISKCYAMANRIEINFLKRESAFVQENSSSAVKICDSVDRKLLSLIVKTLSAIDEINAGNNDAGIRAGLPLLYKLMESNNTSEYLTLLEDALARAYIRRSDIPNAERFALRAFQKAKKENAILLMERTSETMAAIRRAQGQLNSAFDFYDINLSLKKKVLDVQLQKNLAYQRVKFDLQDKANQLTLLEQKNKILTVEKQLQYGKNQNLVLLSTLITVLVAILGAWLMRTWRQKNLFRYSAQMDGLTQVSNRAHFIACCNLVFKHADQQVSLVLFDMDNFKKINDTFGHAAGDWVLKNVCATIQKTLRKNDVFGRLGGEEFGLCLVDLTDEEVLACAERWRVAVEEINTANCGYQFSITASFGGASRGRHGLQSFEETLAAADKALYVSKNGGRNRVSMYQ